MVLKVIVNKAAKPVTGVILFISTVLSLLWVLSYEGRRPSRDLWAEFSSFCDCEKHWLSGNIQSPVCYQSICSNADFYFEKFRDVGHFWSTAILLTLTFKREYSSFLLDRFQVLNENEHNNRRKVMLKTSQHCKYIDKTCFETLFSQ